MHGPLTLVAGGILSVVISRIRKLPLFWRVAIILFLVGLTLLSFIVEAVILYKVAYYGLPFGYYLPFTKVYPAIITLAIILEVAGGAMMYFRLGRRQRRKKR